MSTILLSIKPGGVVVRHDPAACLAVNGKIVAGVEEERFKRIKHASGIFPNEAIKFCLESRNLKLSDVDEILIPFKRNETYLYNLRIAIAKLLKRNMFSRDLSTLGEYLSGYHKWEGETKEELEVFFNPGPSLPDIKFINHHLCHAASGFYPSGFKEALLISIDGRGSEYSTTVWIFDENGYELIKSYKPPNSLGFLYGAFTIFLGFRMNNGEGKVMALAGYGKPTYYERLCEYMDPYKYDVKKICDFSSKGISKIEDLLGVKRRLKGEPIRWEHKNIAASVQKFLEEAVIHLVEESIEETGLNNVCLSGGVALNCKMNKEVRELPQVKNIFIQPVASDAGTLIGAVLLRSKELGFDPSFKMIHTYFGPEYTDDEIKHAIEETKLPFKEVSSPSKVAARLLSRGLIVGWFQGKLEMGPRALGNRSILADPREAEMSDKINRYVKHRQVWRPFSPSILEDKGKEYLENFTSSPFMIDTFKVKSKKKSDMKATIHKADDTVRPQTVSKKSNPLYYRLIKEFYKLTGVPVILNTSFNDKGEPIVNRPKEALKCYLGTGMDVLVIGKYLLQKKRLFSC